VYQFSLPKVQLQGIYIKYINYTHLSSIK